MLRPGCSNTHQFLLASARMFSRQHRAVIVLPTSAEELLPRGLSSVLCVPDLDIQLHEEHTVASQITPKSTVRLANETAMMIPRTDIISMHKGSYAAS